MMHAYSTETISEELLSELSQALKSAGPFGSVEIFIQNNIVTQITLRNIRKTSQGKKQHGNISVRTRKNLYDR